METKYLGDGVYIQVIIGDLILTTRAHYDSGDFGQVIHLTERQQISDLEQYIREFKEMKGWQ